MAATATSPSPPPLAIVRNGGRVAGAGAGSCRLQDRNLRRPAGFRAWQKSYAGGWTAKRGA